MDILSSLSTDQPGAARACESVGAEILRVVSAYEAVERRTGSRDSAIHRLRTQSDRFNSEVVKALTDVLGLEISEIETIEIPIGRVCIDMIVAEDICLRTGALLVPKGYRVSESFVARLGNFNPDLLPTVIRVRKYAND